MSDIAIKVENLGKLYRLGEVGTGTLSHDLNRWIARMRGKEDPFAMIGETNDRTIKSESDYVWALKDVNFEVKQGEVLGIIGRNGAGKSTLLKLLSKVTQPSEGHIKVKGRIASLLEVGTGFHPEMTGRENIFLNGAIMGMTKKEIKAKFDEIVDFAGVERYVDTPVKRYSSGMYVRLAFAVAAFLEPEILIVDEVLAVGDAEFQKKCLGRMKDVSTNDGRTVLFVSHNMAAVKQLCTHGLLMKNGTVLFDGSVDKTLERYLDSDDTGATFKAVDSSEKPTQVIAAAICNSRGEHVSELEFDETIHVTFTIKNNTTERGMRCNLALWDTLDQLLFVERIEIPPAIGYKTYTAQIPGGRLVPNRFKLGLALDIPGIKLYDVIPEQLYFDIIDTGAQTSKYGDRENGIFIPEIKWLLQ